MKANRLAEVETATGLLLLACALYSIWLVFGADVQKFFARPAKPPVTAVSQPPTFVYGPPEARFTLVEYADLECPYCKAAFPQLKQLVERIPELNWQWQHLPLAMHGEAARYEARLATCAGWYGGNPAFWQAVEAIYQHSRSNGAGLAVPIDQLGLQPAVSLQHLQACVQHDETVRTYVAEQIKAGVTKGIDATPTLELTDNRTGRTVRLPALLDEAGMLSAMDWLATQGRANAQSRR